MPDSNSPSELWSIERGPSWDTMIDGAAGSTVSDLIEELYERAGQQGNWMVVRQVRSKYKNKF